jgi:hypothetical protein
LRFGTQTVHGCESGSAGSAKPCASGSPSKTKIENGTWHEQAEDEPRWAWLRGNVEPELQFRRTANCGLMVFSPFERAYIAPDFGAPVVARRQFVTGEPADESKQ